MTIPIWVLYPGIDTQVILVIAIMPSKYDCDQCCFPLVLIYQNGDYLLLM